MIRLVTGFISVILSWLTVWFSLGQSSEFIIFEKTVAPGQKWATAVQYHESFIDIVAAWGGNSNLDLLLLKVNNNDCPWVPNPDRTDQYCAVAISARTSGNGEHIAAGIGDGEYMLMVWNREPWVPDGVPVPFVLKVTFR